MKTGQLKPMGCSKSSSKREVYSNTILPQETRKASNRQPNFTPETTGKEKPQLDPGTAPGRHHFPLWCYPQPLVRTPSPYISWEAVDGVITLQLDAVNNFPKVTCSIRGKS